MTLSDSLNWNWKYGPPVWVVILSRTIIITSPLTKFSMSQSIARPFCNSWVSCSSRTVSCHTDRDVYCFVKDERQRRSCLVCWWFAIFWLSDIATMTTHAVRISVLLLSYVHCVPKNETCVILNILYSCKSTAMKFSVWYPDDLSY